MRAAIDSFISLFLLSVIMVIASLYITSSVTASDARDFHATAVSAIESSNGAQTVIDQMTTEAKKKGYDISIVPTKIVEEKQYFYVKVSYHYQIPIVGNVVSNTIEGYAR